MIQVIVGVFALFGILSFFAIRWQSIQQAETFAEGKIEKVFSSEYFRKRLNDAASKANDLQVESLQESLGSLSDLSQRIAALEEHIAAQAPENEPEAEEDSE
jgi:flagellar motility protein MotE (MotC chaperone)